VDETLKLSPGAVAHLGWLRESSRLCLPGEAGTGRIGAIETPALASEQPAGGASHVAPALDANSRAWLAALRASGPDKDGALRKLHALLLRAARHEAYRRRPSLPDPVARDLDDLALQAADDALLSITGKLDDFRGDSRFTTWAYMFAIVEVSSKLRRHAWRGRRLNFDEEQWSRLPDRLAGPDDQAEGRELLRALRDAIATQLSARQREVFIAVALNGVPIDVLAERMDSTRGALYKVLHDARRRLRACLEEQGLGRPQLKETQ